MRSPLLERAGKLQSNFCSQDIILYDMLSFMETSVTLLLPEEKVTFLPSRRAEYVPIVK